MANVRDALRDGHFLSRLLLLGVVLHVSEERQALSEPRAKYTCRDRIYLGQLGIYLGQLKHTQNLMDGVAVAEVAGNMLCTCNSLLRQQ